MSVDVRRSPPIKAEIKARKRETDHRNDLSFLTMMYIYEGKKGVGMYLFIYSYYLAYSIPLLNILLISS